MEKRSAVVDRVKRGLSETAAYLYIAGCGLYLLYCVQSLGLYSDDYWNLQVSSTRSVFGYLGNHLSHTNTRYTYALYHRLLTALFFDKAHLFGEGYIRFAYAVGVLMHLANCALMFRLGRRLGIRAAALWAILPIVVFPVFGRQAVLWIGAYMAHVLGLLCFLVAASAVIDGRRLRFVVATTLAVGASEFVLLPSLMLLGFAVWEERRRCGEPDLRACIRKIAVRSWTLLVPFVVYGAVVLASRGMHRRIHVLEQYTKAQLWTSPLTSIGRLFGHYLPTLQPVPLFHDIPILILLFFAGLMLLGRSKIEGMRTGVLLGVTAAAVFPLAAVGYYTGGTRLRYIVGFFFMLSVAQGISAVVKRWDTARMRRLFGVAAALSAVGFTLFGAVRFAQFSKEGSRAYGCIKSITLHLYEETDGVPPKKIEWCGKTNRVGEFPVINKSSLPRALALMYGSKEPVKIKRHKQCGNKRTPFFAPAACTNPMWYRIQMK